MKLEDLTQDQVNSLKARLDEAEALKTKYAELEQKYSKTVDDIKTLTNGGSSEEAHNAAMFRLMQRTELYTDDQITKLIKESGQEDPGLEGEEIDLGNNSNDEMASLKEQILGLERELRTSQASTLSSYTQERVAGVSRKGLIEALKKVAEEKGVPFQEPGKETMDFFMKDIGQRVKSKILEKSRMSGKMPTQQEVDAIIAAVVPERTTEIRSVMADPALMRKAETVSGSTGDADVFRLPEKEVAYPDLKKVSSGELDKDQARIQQDAARVDRLSRLAAATSSKDDVSAV